MSKLLSGGEIRNRVQAHWLKNKETVPITDYDAIIWERDKVHLLPLHFGMRCVSIGGLNVLSVSLIIVLWLLDLPILIWTLLRFPLKRSRTNQTPLLRVSLQVCAIHFKNRYKWYIWPLHLFSDQVRDVRDHSGGGIAIGRGHSICYGAIRNLNQTE